MLKSWIVPYQEKLNKGWLSRNFNAVPFLEQNPELINWWYLSENPNAIHLLEANPDKINFYNLTVNVNAIHLLEIEKNNLEKNLEKIEIYRLCYNTEAIPLLREINKIYPEKIRWDILSGNPKAVQWLEENPEKINWYILSRNPKAIHLLKENPEKIDWNFFSINTHPEAIEMLFDAVKYSPEKLDKTKCWGMLCRNTEAIPILQYVLETTPEKIVWNSLACNPNAISLLEPNLDKLDKTGWNNLCGNYNAIHLLETVFENNPEQIDWNMLSENIAIFDEDYAIK